MSIGCNIAKTNTCYGYATKKTKSINILAEFVTEKVILIPLKEFGLA